MKTFGWTSVRPILATLAVAALAGAALPAAAAADGLTPSCPLPFAAIAGKHPVDADCDAPGKPTSSDKTHAQNTAKNNFCATGDPAWVTRVSFRKLQAAAAQAGITFGSDSKLPEDRSALANIYKTSEGATIGEGSKVRLVAFVKDAHYSNVSNGESVNCGETGKEANDIHIVTVQDPADDECTSVTAEMSPHFRPDGWTPAALNALQAPVRFTGQLFFDGSHRPCTAGHPQNPKRIAIWEIHPVYAVDVCSGSTLADCPVGDETKWKPLVPAPAAANP